MKAVGKRHHAARDDFVIQAMGQVFQAAGKALEPDNFPGDRFLGGNNAGQGFLKIFRAIFFFIP